MGLLWVGIADVCRGLGLQQLAEGVWKPFVTPEFGWQVPCKFEGCSWDREKTLFGLGHTSRGIYRIQWP